MTTSGVDSRYYWERFPGRDGVRVPLGEHLAALRRGLGREPGAVPEMWRYYSRLREDGALSPALRAEHAALSLFGLHQQSKDTLMHRGRTSVGRAVLQLKRSGRYSEDAVDRRFTAAATATTQDELVSHLRGLVAQLREVAVPMDYTQLTRDLEAWSQPGRLADVRRRWGAAYFDWRAHTETASAPDRTEETA